MKLMKNSARLFVTFALLAVPLASSVAEDKMDKMNDGALMEPVKSVFDDYLKIQGELAKDSTAGVSEHASAIAKAVRGDKMQMLPTDVATQADALAHAEDLKAARTAFKPLSDSLIKYLADNKAGKGTYREAFCPMANASWLQMGSTIKNPYMGKGMSGCGEFRN